jgi:hypothetical protein
MNIDGKKKKRKGSFTLIFLSGCMGLAIGIF